MNVTVCLPSRIVGKRFEMHEIPGIVFVPFGQTQQAFQRCLFLHQEGGRKMCKVALKSTLSEM